MIDLEKYQLENFELSKDAKKWWLSTRKSSNTVCGVLLPGLFQTSQYTLDTLSFISIIILEIIGMYNLQRVGQFNWIFIAGLFLADIVFAFVLHIFQGRECKTKNLMILEDDEVMTSVYKRKLRRWKTWELFWGALIILIAIFKIMSFYSLYGIMNGLVFFILLTYAIVAVLHITTTGFFISELKFRLRIKIEYSKFLNSAGSGSPNLIKRHLSYKFDSDVDLVESKIQKHQLTKLKENLFELKTWGVLSDDDLRLFILEQSNHEQKRKLALEGLRHQMEILETNPAH